MGIFGDDIESLKIIPNFNTNKVRIELANGYTVDFSQANTIRTLLGFDSIVVSTDQEGNSIASVNTVEKVLIHTSLVNSTYLGSSVSDVIGEHILDKPPGSQLQEKPAPLIWIPMSENISRDIDHIRVYYTDQNNDPINFVGESTTVQLYIRKMRD